MSSVVFSSEIPLSEGQQTNAEERVATGISWLVLG
jgi:hypothetical protein